ncbi:MAG: SusC/RagA family TonB-linked outer membrane protein, partial [Bacteroidetes bacterium]|nr:SusC/RagA family TonB-linked outer membrane protein [Bacteroidota bacterium]
LFFSTLPTKSISGKITDQQGQPIPFATIKIKGTKAGTAADADGNFVIKAPATATLLITGTGIGEEEVPIAGQTNLTIKVNRKESNLAEVVVTTVAGTKVSKRQQGFASTTITASSITQAKPTSLASALTGKAPGLQIMATGGGVNPSYRILLRGQRSFTGNNQPLIIVDGNVVTSDLLTNISPEDIDNVNILNGPASVALYGSQASNGALVVTTKRPLPGTQSVHLGQTITFEKVAFYPKTQTQYGSGGSGYGTDTLGNPYYSPLENESYGPKFDGSMKPLGNPLENGDQLMVPYQYFKDRNKFWQTGASTQTDISLSSADDRSSFYLAGQYLSTTGTMLGDKFKRASIRFNGMRKIGNKVRANYSLSYLQNRYDVTPLVSTIYDQFLNMPGNIPITKFRDWQNNEYANPNGYYNPWYGNPYFTAANNRQLTNNDYITGSLELHYMPFSWLDIISSTGLTMKTTVQKNYTNSFVYTPYATTSSGGFKTTIAGSYGESSQYYNEVIQNIKGVVQKKFGNFSVNVIAGAAFQQDAQDNLGASIGGLVQGNLFNLSNTLNYPSAYNTYFKARQFGAYYDVQLGWNDYLFLHTSGREDIVSVLNPNNRKFFYPAADLSLIVTNAIQSLSNVNWLDFWKIRANVAKVGQVNLGPGANPYGAYSLLPTFGQGNGYPYNGIAGYAISSTLISSDLKPEITKSWEIGTDFRLFHSFVDAAITYYDERTSNQTLTTSVSWTSGFGSLLTNVGESESKGLESSVKFNFINRKIWSLSLATTYTYNSNVALSITPGLDRLPLATYGATGTYAVPHLQWPEIYGYDYMRHNGKVIVDPVTGLPVVNTGVLVPLGNANARNIVSLIPTITFKSFTLTGVFEYRGGFKRYNNMGFDMDWSGMGIRTTQFNRQRFVFPNSTYQDGAGKWVDNTTVLISENGNGNSGFWTDATENYNVTSNYVTSGAFWKLRELSLTYSLPQNFLKATKAIKSASLSLVGRNLFIWLPKDNLYTDPDYSDAGNQSNGIGLTGYQTPPSRYMGFNLSVNF